MHSAAPEGYAFGVAKVLTSAVELGVFTAFPGPLAATHLFSSLGLIREAPRFLDAPKARSSVTAPELSQVTIVQHG